jgi:hypothetical protein
VSLQKNLFDMPEKPNDKPEFKEGQKVTWRFRDKGIIKSVVHSDAFVVFHCENRWDRYFDYTGQRCNLSDLTDGW